MGRGKKRAGFRWWGDWSFLWVMGGFGVLYLAFVPLKNHPMHWLLSVVGGVVGYGVGLLFDAGYPRVQRFLRSRSGAAMPKQAGKHRQRGNR